MKKILALLICILILCSCILPVSAAKKFADVPAKAYFAHAVNWAVDNGVTAGMTATTFAPNDTCTRAQAVTFIWRANGSPEPSGTNNPFNDVKSKDYFYKAVLWAVEKGITSGMTPSTFGPSLNCTRGQIVTFLWNSEGKTKIKANNPFNDVNTKHYFYNAVLWAVENGITAGMSNNSFAPGNDCTRAQIVTFLMRHFDDTAVKPIKPTGPSYTWVLKSGIVNGDIQPIYEMMTQTIHPCDASYYIDGSKMSLISYNGSIITELPFEYNNTDSFLGYCSHCRVLTDHYTYKVHLDSYTITETFGGHGGNAIDPYIYDKYTKKLYSASYGQYFVENPPSYAIVDVSCKRSLTEEEKDFYDTDYKYQSEGYYGLVINGELKEDGFDAYTRYSCGVTAMRRNGKWGYYDTDGNAVFDCEYDPAQTDGYDINYNPICIPYYATEGIIVLHKNGKWGFGDVNGNMLTDFEFEEARPVYNNRAWVKTSEGWGVIKFDHEYTSNPESEVADYDACSHFAV